MPPNPKAEKLVQRYVDEGKITDTVGKLYLHKYNINGKVLSLYKKVQRKENSPLTQEELRDIDIDLIRWDIKTADQQPLFFRQFPSGEFGSYKVPNFDLHSLLDIRDYCDAASTKLGECFSDSEHVKTGKTLLHDAGWDSETFDKLAACERGDRDNPTHRYEWGTYAMFCKENLPHTIVASTHLSSEPELSLRSELMILLLTIYGKGLKEECLAHEITPVLLLSIRIEHLRLIEAYYDGSKVIVRFSDPIHLRLKDSSKQQQEAVNWVLRWLAATPVGDTSKLSSLKTARS
ncbi:hypothetical protein FQN54_009571 [Arachnomyces sp. PD_36]|nr:hypothetical protein FQN54_009571 [Arachnomyces sp. PD_36]